MRAFRRGLCYARVAQAGATMDALSNDSINALAALGAAVAIGFLIGFEREWQSRADGRTSGFAGARTFTLVGFVGGLCGLISVDALSIAALALIGVLTVAAYLVETRQPQGGRGGTTEIALLATFLLGFAATSGMLLAAAVGGVAVVVILSLKDEITRLAGAIEAREIHAALQLLVVSVLILPLLPDRGFGPYGAINPRAMWMLVVFISGLSFIGYFLMKWMGASHGAALTGLVGGLASSTATTLSLSRLARDNKGDAATYAAGIVGANVVMLGRIGVLVALIAPAAFVALRPALAVGAMVGAAVMLAYWRRGARSGAAAAVDIGNPFELRPALVFAVILGFISVIAAWASDRYGAAGLQGVALLSGFTDIEAIIITASRQAQQGDIDPALAASAALIAAASNGALKAGISAAVGGARLGIYVAAAFIAIFAAAAAAHAML